jgi:hypothetical protein
VLLTRVPQLFTMSWLDFYNVCALIAQHHCRDRT